MKRIFPGIFFLRCFLLSAALITISSCFLPKKQEQWTVITWNTQNIFDAYDDGSEYPEFDPGREKWNERLYHRRLQRAGQVLKASYPDGADLIVLQEIENIGVLEDLVDGPLKGMGYRWQFVAPGPGAIRCGVISRYPARKISATDTGFWGKRSLRPLLGFIIDRPLESIQVFVVHWKSPRDGREKTEKARRLESEIAAQSIKKSLMENPDSKILLIGDLNTPGDAAIKPAALAPWSAELGTGREEAPLYRVHHPEGVGLQDGKVVLFDPEPNPQKGPIGTYWFQKNWSRPDRALLSKGLLEGKGLIFHTAYVPASKIMGDSMGRPLRWISQSEDGYSDHLPLLLIFRPQSQ